jgi:2-polyprenyl-3-methyl-5-hydroxy-6-metoxy-1,4-benzoquinol methylase
VDEEIRVHYATGVEVGRLSAGASRIEFDRTKELLGRVLPPPPATILDVGGGPGAYAEWLAGQAHDVRLIDPLPLRVEEARALEREPSVLGVNLHLLAIARRPEAVP